MVREPLSRDPNGAMWYRARLLCVVELSQEQCAFKAAFGKLFNGHEYMRIPEGRIYLVCLATSRAKEDATDAVCQERLEINSAVVAKPDSIPLRRDCGMVTAPTDGPCRRPSATFVPTAVEPNS